MRAHHLYDQSLAVLAVVGVSAYEVGRPGFVEIDDSVAVVEDGDRMGHVAVEVAKFFHHKNGVIRVLETCSKFEKANKLGWIEANIERVRFVFSVL